MKLLEVIPEPIPEDSHLVDGINMFDQPHIRSGEDISFPRTTVVEPETTPKILVQINEHERN